MRWWSPSPRTLLLAGAALLLLFAASVFVPVSGAAALVPDTLPADGRSSARLTWSAVNVYGNPVPLYPGGARLEIAAGGDKVQLLGQAEGKGSKLELALRAGLEPGVVELVLRTAGGEHPFTLNLFAGGQGDQDGDGMPDAVELLDPADREAFRGWFTAIAEAQFYKLDPRWAAVHRDCAGLARFAYREALRRHDAAWLSKLPYLHHAIQSELRRYHYPEVPLLGRRVFRIAPGPYRAEEDVAQTFSSSAGARALWEFNTVPVSRDATEAMPGDLLFFRDVDHPESPMHTMILIDGREKGRGRRVVYHTGVDDAGGPGEVRLVTLADLDRHRDDRWHPRPNNPNFLGFFRWTILDGGRP